MGRNPVETERASAARPSTSPAAKARRREGSAASSAISASAPTKSTVWRFSVIVQLVISTAGHQRAYATPAQAPRGPATRRPSAATATAASASSAHCTRRKGRRWGPNSRNTTPRNRW